MAAVVRHGEITEAIVRRWALPARSDEGRGDANRLNQLDRDNASQMPPVANTELDDLPCGRWKEISSDLALNGDAERHMYLLRAPAGLYSAMTPGLNPALQQSSLVSLQRSATDPSTASSPTTEASVAGRVVAVLIPLISLGSAWLAKWIASRTAIQLDSGQVTAFMVAIATATVASGLTWLHGWQLHEQRVAAGTASPIKPATPPPNSTPAAA